MSRNSFVMILAVSAFLASMTVYLTSSATPRVQAQGKGEPVYAQLSSMKTQTPKTTGPTLAMMESNDALSGMGHDDKKDTDKITVKTKGVYFMVAAVQVGRDAGTSDDHVDVWMRVNGKDVDNSNTRQTIKDGKFTAVVVCQGIGELNANDVVSVAYSVSATGKGLGMIATAPKGEPGIPSIIFSMYKIN